MRPASDNAQFMRPVIVNTFLTSALKESSDWTLLSSFCDDSNLRIYVFK